MNFLHRKIIHVFAILHPHMQILDESKILDESVEHSRNIDKIMKKYDKNIDKDSSSNWFSLVNMRLSDFKRKIKIMDRARQTV